jgi:hypothetical protein
MEILGFQVNDWLIWGGIAVIGLLVLMGDT